jgi:small subunit ribosomal protein S3Ae
MAKARARTQARKVKDKWKAKQWYQLVAPAMFNKAVLAETLTDEMNKLVGRVVTTSLQDLTGDFKQMHVKLDFQVSEVTGNQAQTIFVGHSMTSDYTRRMVRRNHTKISSVYDVTTKDGSLVRVKPFAVTERRAQSSQQTQIRDVMKQTLTSMAAELTLAGFLREILEGRASTAIYKGSKKFYPLRRVEIYKTEVRTPPSIIIEDDVKAYGQDVVPEAPEGEEPTAEESTETPEAEAVEESEEPSEEESEVPEEEAEAEPKA